METEPNVVDKAITHPIEKNKIDTVNKTDKPQASKSKTYKSISNESNKVISLDKSSSLNKSRASQRTETKDTVKTINKSRYISLASIYDKITNMEQPKEIDVIKYSPDISGMSGPGASVTTI